MLHRSSPFLKLQEYVDCFAEATAADEFGSVSREADPGEAALKWLALALLHGVARRAEAIELSRSAGGELRATTDGEDLPSPGRELAPRVFDAVRAVTHLEGDRGVTPLALGIRNDSLELEVAVNRTPGGEAMTIRLPRFGTA